MWNYEFLLLNSPSGFGWYCRFSSPEYAKYSQRKYNNYFHDGAELWSNVKDENAALEKFKETIRSFGASEEDVTKIEVWQIRKEHKVTFQAQPLYND